MQTPKQTGGMRELHAKEEVGRGGEAHRDGTVEGNEEMGNGCGCQRQRQSVPWPPTPVGTFPAIKLPPGSNPSPNVVIKAMMMMKQNRANLRHRCQ